MLFAMMNAPIPAPPIVHISNGTASISTSKLPPRRRSCRTRSRAAGWKAPIVSIAWAQGASDCCRAVRNTTMAMRRLAAASGSFGDCEVALGISPLHCGCGFPAGLTDQQPSRCSGAVGRNLPNWSGRSHEWRCVGIASDRDILRQFSQHRGHLLEQQPGLFIRLRRPEGEHRLAVSVADLDAQPIGRCVDHQLTGQLLQLWIVVHHVADLLCRLLERLAFRVFPAPLLAPPRLACAGRCHVLPWPPGAAGTGPAAAELRTCCGGGFGGGLPPRSGALLSVSFAMRAAAENDHIGAVGLDVIDHGEQGAGPRRQAATKAATATGAQCAAAGEVPVAAAAAGRGDARASQARRSWERNWKSGKKSFEQAAQQIRDVVNNDPQLQELARQLVIETTPDGLRIQIRDADRQPMFAFGSAEPNEKPGSAAEVAPVLTKLTQDISIAGHTDAAPFVGSGRSDWELSADRANTTRRLDRIRLAGNPHPQCNGKCRARPRAAKRHWPRPIAASPS